MNFTKKRICWGTFIIFSFFTLTNNLQNYSYAFPSPIDHHLKIEKIFTAPLKPTTMAFLGPNDFLILDRENGKVFRVVDGQMNTDELIDVNVGTVGYRGMLGIATHHKGNQLFVFLYFTESRTMDGDDEPDSKNFKPLGNRVYRYELVGNKLIHPTMLLDLPAIPGPRHMGGIIAVGPDENLYVSVGDLDGTFRNSKYETTAQNYLNGTSADGRSGILRVTLDGKPVSSGILGDSFPLKLYYAYGIRNSFGMDWDPVTGNLWDTENGPHYGDEVNIVKSGFNSGWAVVQGYWEPELDVKGKKFTQQNKLVNFDGRGKYSPPEFIWMPTVAPTAIRFISSERLGVAYQNDLLVGDANTGTIFHFILNSGRTGLQLSGRLIDKVANDTSELKSLVFATGFGRITDIQLGPDGYPYVLSSSDEGASVYRILPQK